MIKSILIAKHLTMLSSGGEIDKIYYLIDSKYRYAIENILKQNTKNEKGQVIAQELGHVNTLVQNIPEMDTNSTFLKKYAWLSTIAVVFILTINNLFPLVEEKFFQDNYVDQYEKELQIEQNLNKRLLIKYDKKFKEHKELTACITKNSDGEK